MSNTLWEIIKPKATTNLIINPSIEKGTTNWAGNNTTLSRVSDEKNFGSYSMKCVTTTNTSAHAYYTTETLSSGTTYTFSVFFKADSGNSFLIAIADTSSVELDTTSFTSNGAWQRIEVTRAENSSVARRVIIGKDNDAIARTFYVDGGQFEDISGATTYCDGYQPGCVWAGGAHSSKSTRLAESRDGGEIINLNSDYDIIVMQQPGAGMPAISNIKTDLGLQDGALFQRNRALTRSIILEGVISGSDVNSFHFNRQRLIDLVKSDLVPNDQGFLLRYTGVTGVTKQIKCHYDGGLEFTSARADTETFSMRLIAYDPYWEEIGNGAAVFGGQLEIANSNGILQRTNKGVWQALDIGGGTNKPTLNALKRGTDGLLYAGGFFDGINGSTFSKSVGAWDGTTWWPMSEGIKRSYTSSGLGNVRAIAIGANGDVYVAGEFDIAGSSAACGVARWEISTCTWNSVVDINNTGLNNTRVWDMDFAADGTLYVTGCFQDAGGSNDVNHMFKYDGTNASPLGTGAAASGVVRSVAIDSVGKVYLAGQFDNMGGVSTSGLATWDNSALTFEALGASPQIDNVAIGADVGRSGSNGGTSISVAPDGLIYLTGEFEQVSGVSTCHAAVWDGVSWKKLGSTNQLADKSGTETGRKVFADQDTNLIYFGGTMTKAGGLALKDGYAIWNGTSWIVPDIDLTTLSPFVEAILVDPDGTLTVGYSLNINGPYTASAATGSTISNTGTATTSPCVLFSGEGKVIQIRNDTTGKQIQFDFTLNSGEEVVLDVSNRTLFSSFRGNIIGDILPGGDLAEWNLLPGINDISSFMDSESGSANFTWKTKHWSFDGGAS